MSETRQLFFQFLEHENSKHLLLFYEAAMVFYQNVKNQIWLLDILSTDSESQYISFDIYKEIDFLLRNYLYSTSHFPIALFDYCRRKTIVQLEHRWYRRTTILEDSKYFISEMKELMKFIYGRLKDELFYQFVQSPLWFQFTLDKEQSKSLERLCNKLAVKRNANPFFKKIMFCWKEVWDDFIREKDFQIIFQLSHDNSNSIWKTYDNRIQISHFNCIADAKDNSQIKWIKCCDYLSIPIESLVGMLISGQYISQQFVFPHQPSSVQHLQTNIPDQSSTLPFWNEETELRQPTASTILKILPKSLVKKELLTAMSMKKLPHLDQYLFIVKSCFHSTLFPQQARSKQFHGLLLQKIAPHETKIIVTMHVQSNGPSLWSTPFLKQLIIVRVNQYMKRLTAMCAEFMDKYPQWSTGNTNSNSCEQAIKEMSQSIDTFDLAKVMQWNDDHLCEITREYEPTVDSTLFDVKLNTSMNAIKVRI